MKFLFVVLLTTGLARGSRRRATRICEPKPNFEPINEADESRVCRRNVIALAGVVVIAGLAGSDPNQLEVFGVEPDPAGGAAIIGAAVITAHLYWYVQRSFHMAGRVWIRGRSHEYLTVRLETITADWVGNAVAFGLALWSWCYAGSWIVCSWVACNAPPAETGGAGM